MKSDLKMERYHEILYLNNTKYTEHITLWFELLNVPIELEKLEVP